MKCFQCVCPSAHLYFVSVGPSSVTSSPTKWRYPLPSSPAPDLAGERGWSHLVSVPTVPRMYPPLASCGQTNTCENKKGLLRERKRHTTRCIASTRHAVPVGGTPPPQSWDLTWVGGTPPSWDLTWAGGYPPSSPPPSPGILPGWEGPPILGSDLGGGGTPRPPLQW